MNIPEDWRELDALEQIKAGDLFKDGDEWREVGEAEIDAPAVAMLATVIRKKETT